jgi:hypothetical protein
MKKIMIATLLAALSACGGGGSGGSAPAPVSDLEGTWVYTSGSHATGGTCGLDIHGGYEQRIKYVFSGSSLKGTLEDCMILQGNTGAFFESKSTTGSFVTGGEYLTFNGEVYKTIDVTSSGKPQYSAYNITGITLKFTQPTTATDGSTPGTRAAGISGQVKFIKQ